ncbi:aminoglycoside phosphotransferase family protein [Scytonema sp. UIC 10036]|uniref:phosphotransferase family protein n=1 Tax=Scytonema sp. UIC 10036 TaxID=2304196 RepID=UPI001FA9B999|nr:aminoglycoside phosphotransferase family protein [Scytonema sp. UIC 10036]
MTLPHTPNEVKGTQFTEVMHCPISEPFAAVGRVLAQLHSMDLRPETVWTSSEELARFRYCLKGVKRALPQLKAQLNSVLALLQDLSHRLPFLQNQPIHGNLHGDRILYSPDGIGVVDWDALSLGDPLYDVGRLLAGTGARRSKPISFSASAQSWG